MQADSTGRNIRAVVVDDAAFMRKALVEILSDSGEIDVVGVAKHGKEALDAIKTLKPDVITLDVDMPVMDGLTTMKHIMIRHPLPVVMVSGLADQGRITFEALSLGAVDFFPKPSGTISDDIHDSAAELVRTLKAAAGINPEVIKRAARLKGHAIKKQAAQKVAPEGLLIVVALQGAVSSFIRLASALFPIRATACLCIQDMSSSVLRAYARELDLITGCSAAFEPEQMLWAGCCTLASRHNLPDIQKDTRGITSLKQTDYFLDMNALFQSASRAFGENLNVCILGGQVDGNITGLQAVRMNGGMVAALNPEKCASGDFARRAIAEKLATPFDTEHSLWAGIKAFSRRMIIKKGTAK